MSWRSLPLPDACPGSLWLGPMPGRFEPWPAFLAEARRHRVDLVVCLTSQDELASLSARYWQAVAEGSLDFRFINLPMQNYGLPRDLAGFRAGIGQVASALASGDTVFLHCAAGIGRTGTAAACLLKHLGLDTDEAVQRVRDAGSNPENALQSGLVDRF